MGSQSKFVVHHVGGRAGSVGFPDLPTFRDEVANVIYDADESCLTQVDNIWRGRHAAVLPYCLSNTQGTASFHINHCPYTSSLFPANPAYGHYYHKGIRDTDYAYIGAMNTQRITEVQTVTLDYLVEKNLVAPPDFLSIDTQGAELPILEGAATCLHDHVVAVLSEINFVPLYLGAPLFGQLDEFLRKNNFLLASIETIDLGYKRIGRSCRGAGIPLQGEALYLLRPECVAGPDPATISTRLQKLAFAAVTFGYTELACEAIERALCIDRTAASDGKIHKFLLDFYREVKTHADIPSLWHEVMSFEQSNQRFITTNGNRGVKQLLALFIRRPARYFPIIASSVLTAVMSRFLVLLQSLTLRTGIQLSRVPKRSPFEAFMLRSGFDLAAQRIRQRRLRSW